MRPAQWGWVKRKRTETQRYWVWPNCVLGHLYPQTTRTNNNFCLSCLGQIELDFWSPDQEFQAQSLWIWIVMMICFLKNVFDPILYYRKNWKNDAKHSHIHLVQISQMLTILLLLPYFLILSAYIQVYHGYQYNFFSKWADDKYKLNIPLFLNPSVCFLARGTFSYITTV